MATTPNQLSGVIGFFDNPVELIHATEKVRDARYEYFDTFTPYPVHGLESAQGLKRSAIPYVTFVAGITGCLLGFLLQYWTSAVDWPLIVGGKPLNSWPAFVPIMFECTVLFAGLATVGAMFLFNGLPNIKRKAFDPSLTNNRFAIVIEAPTPVEYDDPEEEASVRAKRAAQFKAFSENEAQAFLKQVGAKDVRSVYAEGWF
jgi:hypothetical protein